MRYAKHKNGTECFRGWIRDHKPKVYENEYLNN